MLQLSAANDTKSGTIRHRNRRLCVIRERGRNLTQQSVTNTRYPDFPLAHLHHGGPQGPPLKVPITAPMAPRGGVLRSAARVALQFWEEAHIGELQQRRATSHQQQKRATEVSCKHEGTAEAYGVPTSRCKKPAVTILAPAEAARSTSSVACKPRHRVLTHMG